MSSDDIWDLKAIDKQIEILKSCLISLKTTLSMGRSCYCHGTSVSCNTSSMLISICNAQIPVIENEIKWLTQNAEIYYIS